MFIFFTALSLFMSGLLSLTALASSEPQESQFIGVLGSTARSVEPVIDEIVIYIEPEDIKPMDQDTFERAQAEQKEQLTKSLAQLDSKFLKRFMEMQRAGLEKMAVLSRKADLPQNEINELMQSSNDFLLRSAEQLTKGTAWSWGFEMQVYAGPAAGRLGQKLIVGLMARVIGEGRLTRKVESLISKGNGFFFTGALGFNVVYAKDSQGHQRTLLQFVGSRARTQSVLTATGLLGYSARAVVSTYEDSQFDPSRERVHRSALQTTTLGIAGTMSSANGILNLSVPVPIPVVGGVALIPMIGAITIYQSTGVRRALLTLDFSKVNPSAMALAFSSGIAWARQNFSTSLRPLLAGRCERIFAR